MEHLGRALVDRGIDTVLLEIENRAGITEGIEAAKHSRAVEIGQHLGRLDLVVAERILLDNDKGIGHKAGLLQ